MDDKTSRNPLENDTI